MHFRILKGYRGFARVEASFRLSPSAKRALQKIARQERVSLSCLIKEAMLGLKKIVEEEIKEAQSLEKKRLGKKLPVKKRGQVIKFRASA